MLALSTGKQGCCTCTLGGPRLQGARLGDTIVVSVKEAHPN